MADFADIGSDYTERWLEAQIEEHAYQLAQAGNEWPYGLGKCKNCGESIDDGRPYCEESCRDDHWIRIQTSMRNGKYRGG